MRKDYWMLDEQGAPIPVDFNTWAAWLLDADRIVKRDSFTLNGQDILVSTVFLGVDHSFGADGPPILWETMIFGGKHDGHQIRYSSRDHALKGHEAALRLARMEGLSPAEKST